MKGMDSAAARFRIVFEKLEEVSEDPAEVEMASLEEAEEISELRKIVLEMTEPPTSTYTTT